MNPFSKAYTPQIETADLAKAQAKGAIMGIKPK